MQSTETKNLLGKRIKELRKTKGYTQEKLSEAIGVDSKHLSRVECGINFPSLDLLSKISKVLDVEPSMLFQTAYLKDRKTLLNEIRAILTNQTDEKIRLFYKILLDISD